MQSLRQKMSGQTRSIQSYQARSEQSFAIDAIDAVDIAIND
jgi:hypothetical protein